MPISRTAFRSLNISHKTATAPTLPEKFSIWARTQAVEKTHQTNLTSQHPSVVSALFHHKNSSVKHPWVTINLWTGASGHSIMMIPARAITKSPHGPSNKSNPLQRISRFLSQPDFSCPMCPAMPRRSGSIFIPMTTLCCQKFSKPIAMTHRIFRGTCIGNCPNPD